MGGRSTGGPYKLHQLHSQCGAGAVLGAGLVGLGGVVLGEAGGTGVGAGAGTVFAGGGLVGSAFFGVLSLQAASASSPAKSKSNRERIDIFPYER